jgi:NDP-sugar pyrophosphorylase family protein
VIAILLVGGMGTRLRPFTLDRPKALLPILNKPFISYQFDLLKGSGVTDVVLAANKSWKKSLPEIQKLARNLFRVHLACEPVPLGTGGAIRYAFDVVQKSVGTKRNNEPVLILNGDLFIDFDVKKLVQSHTHKMAQLTLLVKKVKNPSRFGVVLMDKKGYVKRFIEKPKNPPSKWINAGVYVMNSSIIDSIPTGVPTSVERETFPLLLKKGMRVVGCPSTGYWNDIGTLSSYLAAHRDLIEKKNRWTRINFFRRNGALYGSHCKKIGKVLIQGRVIFGNRCQISSGTKFEGFCVFGSGVKISEGSTFKDVVVMDNVSLGKGVVVRNAIIGSDSEIQDFVNLSGQTIVALAKKSKISSYTRC